MSGNGRETLYRGISQISDGILEEAEQSEPEKKRAFWIKWAAAAACLAVLASLYLLAGAGNAFSVKAYALGKDQNGEIELRETDLLDPGELWGGHYDGETFYVNIGLRYEGENIRSVEFSTEEGFFATQNVKELSDGENVGELHVGADNRLVVFGTEFEHMGSTVTLENGVMDDGLLLFWGVSLSDLSQMPEKAEITAKARFQNGSTQELPVTVDLSGPGAYDLPVSEEQLELDRRLSEYYENIPLEQCEVLEGSVETVTEVYEPQMGGSSCRIEIAADMKFDENGICRTGFSMGEDGAYIPVIRKNEDGSFTGMVYRVPDSLAYPQEGSGTSD